MTDVVGSVCMRVNPPLPLLPLQASTSKDAIEVCVLAHNEMQLFSKLFFFPSWQALNTVGEGLIVKDGAHVSFSARMLPRIDLQCCLHSSIIDELAPPNWRRNSKVGTERSFHGQQR